MCIYFMLDELKDATSKLMKKISSTDIVAYDAAYKFNWENWIRYANSMRMRLSMRMSRSRCRKSKI
ncbi:SusD/RagB family nutrient-binding outer membrane lipoprotein [Sphingobacterium daejeonense]|uniref:SusD/RagB family nutrient-binding outer membrane lipoprotein n=1 Tax=Sphingobacterium daejeonense TaxID=371142 RepID=UPI0010C34601|nr:SusD/RagB family nutrient-binding outer membrane lipoprotein [Sphingobacterium daejeonense]VTP88843.1 Susd and RagB outer membrane lipoprotein [Sphingobacterium daejeonense]